MKMTLSQRYLDANLNVLDKLGFPRAEALDVLDMVEEEFNANQSRIEIDRLADLLHYASERLSNPHLALQMGYKFRIATFAKTGSIYGYCKNLEHVIEMNNRYQRLAIDAGEVVYRQDPDGGHHLCFVPYYTDHDYYRPITDLIIGAYVTAFRWLSWGFGEDILGGHLPYAPPKDMTLHDKIYQSDIVFNSDRICLEFSETAMKDTLTTYDPERLARAQAKLDKLLGTKNAEESLEVAVEEAIRGAIRNGQVTSHVVAERLGQSWSNLRHSLKKSGRGFRERVDDVRKDMFMEMYEAGHSFSQIAQGLAYNDQPSLNRAFHRWYGMNPTQWEVQQQAD